MKEFWDERYATTAYVYGTEPNQFFKQQIEAIQPGKLLLPLEGEGRNAVYAASLGWEVDAFDFSEEAKKKATSLAKKKKVSLSYKVIDAVNFKIPKEKYDAVALVFAHFPPEMRIQFHRKMINSLKSKGYIIMEAFHKKQYANSTGGPPNLDLLYSISDLQSDFNDLEILHLEQVTVTLEEGSFHNGQAEVIRLLAQTI